MNNDEMPDFDKAVDSGIAAKAEYQKNIDSVDEVISLINNVFERRNLNVFLERKVQDMSFLELSLFLSKLSKLERDEIKNNAKNKGEILVKSKNNSDKYVVIATWSMSKNVYPFTLIIGRDKVVCQDKISLAACFAEQVISSPKFWEEVNSISSDE